MLKIYISIIEQSKKIRWFLYLL